MICLLELRIVKECIGFGNISIQEATILRLKLTDNLGVRTTKIVKWNKSKEFNKDWELTLKVIENANEAVKKAFSFSNWMIIHQGNDYY